MITNMTKRAMCNKGTMARKIEFNTTCKLGTPETNRRGRSTRKARKAFTSKPSFIRLDSAVLSILKMFKKYENRYLKQNKLLEGLLPDDDNCKI